MPEVRCATARRLGHFRFLSRAPPKEAALPNDIVYHIDRLAADIAAGDPDELLSTRQIALLSGLSEQWFEIARGKGLGPPFVRMSARRIRYRRDDYVAWLQARSHQSTAEYSTTNLGGRTPGSRVVDGHVVEPPPEAA
jgi:predicted DNA-binding transcriptional regulator AlpA